MLKSNKVYLYFDPLLRIIVSLNNILHAQSIPYIINNNETRSFGRFIEKTNCQNL